MFAKGRRTQFKKSAICRILIPRFILFSIVLTLFFITSYATGIANEYSHADSILAALQNEIVTPTSTSRGVTELYNTSERIQLNYMKALIDLGESHLPLLKSKMENSNGILKDWIAIALSHFKDESAHNELRRILQEGNTQIIKIHAARVIREYQDTLDVPYLITTLEDSSNILVISPLRGQLRQIFTVRQNAISTLAKLGYSVKFDSTLNKYRTIKIK